MTDAGNSNDAGNSAENPRESSRENLVEVALQKRSSNREKVDFLLDAYTKAVNFRQKNWMQSVRFGRPKLAKLKKECHAILTERQQSVEALQREEETIRQEAMQHLAPDEIDNLMEHSIEQLKNLEFESTMETRPPPPGYKPPRINENSPVPLVKQVLIKNTQSSSGSKS